MKEPRLPLSPQQTPYDNLTYVNSLYVSSIQSYAEGTDDYLSSLDSDTRDYVIQHTGSRRNKADIIDCINELHGKGRE